MTVGKFPVAYFRCVDKQVQMKLRKFTIMQQYSYVKLIDSDSYRTSQCARQGQSFAVRRGRILESCCYSACEVSEASTARLRLSSSSSFVS